MARKPDDKLKSCPFCSSEKLELCRTNPRACWVRCHLCGAETPSAPRRADAIANWNTRYHNETIAEFVEDEEEASHE